MGNELSTATITINGCEYRGIPDLVIDSEAYHDYVKDNMVINTKDDATFTATITFNKWMWYKLTGIYDWVLKYCPDKKVVHLVKHGKKERIRKKNFKRAIHIIGEFLDKEEKKP